SQQLHGAMEAREYCSRTARRLGSGSGGCGEGACDMPESGSGPRGPGASTTQAGPQRRGDEGSSDGGANEPGGAEYSFSACSGLPHARQNKRSADGNGNLQQAGREQSRGCRGTCETGDSK